MIRHLGFLKKCILLYRVVLPFIFLLMPQYSNAKIFFVNVDSLQQSSSVGRERYCTYYALYAMATVVKSCTALAGACDLEKKVASLEATLREQNFFEPCLASWVHIITEVRYPWLKYGRTSAADLNLSVDSVGMVEASANLLPSLPSFFGIQEGQVAFCNAHEATQLFAAQNESEKLAERQLQAAMGFLARKQPVGIILSVHNSFFAENVPGLHSIGIGIVPSGDNVEIYYTNSAQAELLPDARKEIIRFVKFMLGGNPASLEMYSGLRQTLYNKRALAPQSGPLSLDGDCSLRKRARDCDVDAEAKKYEKLLRLFRRGLEEIGEKDLFSWSLSRALSEISTSTVLEKGPGGLPFLGADEGCVSEGSALAAEEPAAMAPARDVVVAAAVDYKEPFTVTNLWDFFANAPLALFNK